MVHHMSGYMKTPHKLLSLPKYLFCQDIINIVLFLTTSIVNDSNDLLTSTLDAMRNFPGAAHSLFTFLSYLTDRNFGLATPFFPNCALRIMQLNNRK